MKRIIKNLEPEALSNWKHSDDPGWNPSWAALPSAIKRSLRDALLIEQGYLCCYCETGIIENDCHIEHLRPQKKFPDLDIDYQNLLASCQPGDNENEKPEPRHCGHKKDRWFVQDLMISPLSPDCETRFRYTGAGDIYPDDENDLAARETISRLGLNIDLLRAQRHKAIRAMRIDDLTNQDIQQLIFHINERDEDGRFLPFCQVIQNFLQNYI